MAMVDLLEKVKNKKKKKKSKKQGPVRESKPPPFSEG
jgi:hypothetical protein